MRANARRFILRYDPKTGGALVTVPLSYRDKDLTMFLSEQKAWLDRQHKAQNYKKEAETSFLFKGIIPQIEWQSSRGVRGHYDEDTQTIHLFCPKHLKEKALERFLKESARDELTRLVHKKTAQAGLRHNTIRLKDTTSRWGSCSSSGNLNFSWRIIMAPPIVMDYLVAHEVAHLRHMNHSKDFWSLCHALSEDMTTGKHWLKMHGSMLSSVCLRSVLGHP